MPRRVNQSESRAERGRGPGRTARVTRGHRGGGRRGARRPSPHRFAFGGRISISFVRFSLHDTNSTAVLYEYGK